MKILLLYDYGYEEISKAIESALKQKNVRVTKRHPRYGGQYHMYDMVFIIADNDASLGKYPDIENLNYHDNRGSLHRLNSYLFEDIQKQMSINSNKYLSRSYFVNKIVEKYMETIEQWIKAFNP